MVVAKPPSLTRRVYAVWGVPPETQAYAMAKYSRSAQGMLESIAELSQRRAAEFLETFYFQYGLFTVEPYCMYGRNLRNSGGGPVHLPLPVPLVGKASVIRRAEGTALAAWRPPPPAGGDGSPERGCPPAAVKGASRRGSPSGGVGRPLDSLTPAPKRVHRRHRNSPTRARRRACWSRGVHR